ncbi:MAG: CoB--CoM heterodisulfide reductase iron-sulfur subunit A family protein, partial [Promethearchaeota archaeon]
TKIKIGVYICHCGLNIGGVVNIDHLIEFVKTLPFVSVARQYKFFCSEVGQDIIADDIQNNLVNRVVVAACSPRMHEPTFRRVLISAGLNPYYFVQANIREHATWVHMYDPDGATRIAKDHLRMQIGKAATFKALYPLKVKVLPSSLVIGAGISGINSAIELATQGYQVYLVERELTIGGHMAQLDKTFPTMDCSACILTPKMVDVSRNPKINILSYSEVEKIDGYVGNFQVTIRQKAHYVDQEKCTVCGACAQYCPVSIGNEFDLGMTSRKAIYIPFPQAVPGKYTIDINHCITCGICARSDVCEPDAIRFEDEDKILEVNVGTIIVTTGYDVINPQYLHNYGFGKYENVIDGMQMERLLSSTGPTLGKPLRPSDSKAPHSVAWIQCVGSRDNRVGSHAYCSRVCCLYAIKQARQYKEKHPEADIYIFYIDIRAFGKGYEEFYESAGRDYRIKFICGRVSELAENPEDKSIIIRGEDTLLGKPLEIQVDMVVLSVGLESRHDAERMNALLTIQRSADGFFMEAHPKMRPVDSLTDGIFIGGVAQGPKDIPDAVAQAKAAAASAASLMAQQEIEVEPYFSFVQNGLCSGCRSCINQCPFGAITFNSSINKVEINSIKCKGCGTCVSTCPSNAIIQNHFSTSQLMAIINAVLGDS